MWCALCLCKVHVFDGAQHGECQHIFRNGPAAAPCLAGGYSSELVSRRLCGILCWPETCTGTQSVVGYLGTIVKMTSGYLRLKPSSSRQYNFQALESALALSPVSSSTAPSRRSRTSDDINGERPIRETRTLATETTCYWRPTDTYAAVHITEGRPRLFGRGPVMRCHANAVPHTICLNAFPL